MTGNKAYLADYQDINGGPVAFGGSKGYITGKRKIKTGKLDFEDVSFVKELQPFNLFSVSQMCDKKNNVLFTDTECLVLSPDFKLPDENQILLKVPRQNNMYKYFNLAEPLFSWNFFLRTKDETSAILKDFIRQIENQLNQKVKILRCDNGTEFKNKEVIEFCGLKGIKREYSNARTPQQNGVAERKNRTLIEAARTMLADSFYNTFWLKAVIYCLNVLHRNKPNVAGKRQIPKKNWPPPRLFDLDYLTDSMNYLSVSSENQANIHAGQQESNQNAGTKDKIVAGDSEKEDESAQDCFEVPFWHSYSSTNTSSSKSDKKRGSPREEEQIFLDDLARLQRQEKEANEEAEALRKDFAQETENLVTQAEAAKTSGTNIFSTVSTTAKASGTNFVNTVSIPVGTASANEGLSISNTTNSQEDDYEIPPLEDIHEDATDGIFTHSSYDDEGAVADFTNLEAIVNVSPIPTSRIHPSTLILGDPTSRVQTRSKVNKSSEAHALTQEYFISSLNIKAGLCYARRVVAKFDYANVIKTASTPFRRQMPLVKEMNQSDACSRFQVTPKTSHLSAVKRIFRYLKGKPKLGLWYPRESSFDLESYSDSDYAGANLDRKSTTGGCQFLGRRLITWQCKKQTIVATSTTEAEYVAAASCCGQVLWIQNQMLDYGFNFMNTKIYIDNESTICIVKNPVYHSKTKHIAIRHHFIRDAYEKKLIQVLKIHTNDNVADLLTKAFDVSRFQFLVVSIGMINP
ncbi:putative ribonuclease H-like domain-containing protein [Tanacetum coccineum]